MRFWHSAATVARLLEGDAIYRPKLKSGKPSAVYWVKYYVDGRAVRESTRTDDKETAKRILKAREGAAATGQPVLPRVDRIRYEEVAKALRTHYETTGCRDLAEADGRLAPLEAFFAGGLLGSDRPRRPPTSPSARPPASRMPRSTASSPS